MKAPGNHLPDLTGKVACVTGASSGLGVRIAEVLAAAGAKVALTARREDRLRDLCAQIEAAGGKAHPFALNVRDPEAVADTMSRIKDQLGVIDILVNNAGVTVTERTENFSIEDYRFVMETNFDGAWFCTQPRGIQDTPRRPASASMLVSCPK